MSAALKDPLAFPGGVAHTRLVRPHRLQGWQADRDLDYRAAPGLNYSALKVLCDKTPAHFLHALTAEREPTPAMRWGSIVHGFILEGRTPVVMPSFKGKGSKAAKEEWLAANGTENCVDEEELKALHAMRAAVTLPKGRVEVSGYAQTERFAVKMRADLLGDDGVIYDLKTCGSAAAGPFSKDAFGYGYHLQAAWYLAVANMIEPDRYTSFRWIALEKDAPYACAVYEASPDQIALGSQLIEGAVDVLTQCLHSGSWPAYSQDVTALELPRWARAKEDTDVG